MSLSMANLGHDAQGISFSSHFACQFNKKVILRLSERGKIIETQTIILYMREMHNNTHITQTLSPRSFLANSVSAYKRCGWSARSRK